MSKDLEQLRLNMITSMMDLDYESLLKVKDFMKEQADMHWNNQINDQNVDFVDFSKISKNPKRKLTKPSIVFL